MTSGPIRMRAHVAGDSEREAAGMLTGFREDPLID